MANTPLLTVRIDSETKTKFIEWARDQKTNASEFLKSVIDRCLDGSIDVSTFQVKPSIQHDESIGLDERIDERIAKNLDDKLNSRIDSCIDKRIDSYLDTHLDKSIDEKFKPLADEVSELKKL